jgi:hypothetical protein
MYYNTCDLQEEFIILSMYAITLVTHSFHINYIITIHFDLKMKQFNIINVFVNVIRNSKGLLVLCKLPLRFEKPKYIIEVNYTLYKL